MRGTEPPGKWLLAGHVPEPLRHRFIIDRSTNRVFLYHRLERLLTERLMAGDIAPTPEELDEMDVAGIVDELEPRAWLSIEEAVLREDYLPPGWELAVFKSIEQAEMGYGLATRGMGALFPYVFKSREELATALGQLIRDETIACREPTGLVTSAFIYPAHKNTPSYIGRQAPVVRVDTNGNVLPGPAHSVRRLGEMVTPSYLAKDTVSSNRAKLEVIAIKPVLAWDAGAPDILDHLEDELQVQAFRALELLAAYQSYDPDSGITERTATQILEAWDTWARCFSEELDAERLVSRVAPLLFDADTPDGGPALIRRIREQAEAHHADELTNLQQVTDLLGSTRGRAEHEGFNPPFLQRVGEASQALPKYPELRALGPIGLAFCWRAYLFDYHGDVTGIIGGDAPRINELPRDPEFILHVTMHWLRQRFSQVPDGEEAYFSRPHWVLAAARAAAGGIKEGMSIEEMIDLFDDWNKHLHALHGAALAERGIERALRACQTGPAVLSPVDVNYCREHGISPSKGLPHWPFPFAMASLPTTSPLDVPEETRRDSEQRPGERGSEG